MSEGKQLSGSFHLCPLVTQPPPNLEFEMAFVPVALPDDWSLKRADARNLLARFIVRSARAAAGQADLKQSA